MAKETKTARKPATPRTRRKKVVATHDAIERRAYELHLEGSGDPLANWLRAERELATA
jgi:hypothetical protein